MKQKQSIVVALVITAVAVFMVLYNQKTGGSFRAEADPQPSRTRLSQQHEDGTRAENSNHEREELTEMARLEREKMASAWMNNAAAGLAQAKKALIADLELSTGEAADLEKIFARRQSQLANLLNGEAPDDVETLRKICALLRNKHLREELANVLPPEKLAAFDANEATRERETIEARAYRDMAEINDVVSLTDTQKQQALAALMRNAPAKVEQEADARAYMTLHYGQMLTDIDPSYIRGLSNLVSGSLNHEIPTSNSTGQVYEQWTKDQKAGRIQSEIRALQGILDDQQLARYREHLERELPW